MDIILFWVWGDLVLYERWLVVVFNDCTVRAGFYEPHFWAFLVPSFYALRSGRDMWGMRQG